MNLYYAIINSVFEDKTFSDHKMEWNPHILHVLLSYAILGYIILTCYICLVCGIGCEQDYRNGYCICSSRDSRSRARELRNYEN